MSNIKKITEILEDIALYGGKDSADYDMLREITKTIWNDHHIDLIKELGMDEGKLIMDIDYQMFWYECLGFPANMPLLRGKDGKTMGWYGELPSDFNEISGYHDATITNVAYENGDLSIYIELFGNRGNIQSDKYDIRLIFKNLKKIYLKNGFLLYNPKNTNNELERFKGNEICSVYELPAITYFLSELNIQNDFDVANNRIFYFNLGAWITNDMMDFFIVSDGWDRVLSPNFKFIE